MADGTGLLASGVMNKIAERRFRAEQNNYFKLKFGRFVTLYLISLFYAQKLAYNVFNNTFMNVIYYAKQKKKFHQFILQ